MIENGALRKEKCAVRVGGGRIECIDNIKWILTILMCLFHIQFMGEEKYSVLFYTIKNMGDCVVPAFAIISGFLFWKDIKSWKDIFYKAKRRVRSLLVPYLLWNVIYYIINGLIDTHSIIYVLSTVDVYRDILLGNASPHFWYIFMLMFWVVFSPALFLAYRNKGVLALLFLSQIVYIRYMGNDILHSRFIYIIYTWAGLIGFYCPGIISKMESLKDIQKIIICDCSWIFFFLIYWLYTTVDMGQRFIWWFIAFRAILLIIGAIYLPSLKIGSITNYRYAFWLFAVHYWLDVRVSSKIFSIIGITPIYQILTFVIVLIIGIGSGMIVNRLMPKSFNLLNGSRGI